MASSAHAFGQQPNLTAAAGVAPERQKVMVKGGMLKDDQEWAKAGIKPGAKLMMMGTADAVPQAPHRPAGAGCNTLAGPAKCSRMHRVCAAWPAPLEHQRGTTSSPLPKGGTRFCGKPAGHAQTADVPTLQLI